jgi:ATP-binding cassette subfamily B multidrug efflux pump
MTNASTATERAPSSGSAVRLGGQLRDLLRPFRARLLIAAAAVLAAAALDLVPPLAIRHVIDAKLTAGRTDGLAALAGLYLAAVAGVQALAAAYGYLAATVAQRSLAVVRGRLFAHLLNLPAGYHDRTAVGDSISRCTADVDAIDDLFSSSAARLLGDTARLATVAVAMVLLSPAPTAAAALVLPPLILLSNALRRRVRDAEHDARITVGALNTQLQEDLSGVEVIRVFGREEQFTNRFRSALTNWLQAVNRSTRANAFYTPGVGLLAALVTALLLWLGAHRTLTAAGVSVGTLTAFVLLFARFFAPLTALGEEWQKVQAALALRAPNECSACWPCRSTRHPLAPRSPAPPQRNMAGRPNRATAAPRRSSTCRPSRSAISRARPCSTT